MFNSDTSKENTIACFKKHNEGVIAECPSDKLLVFEVSQGWAPLCTFLEKPIPDVPFPHLNDSAEIARVRTVMNVIGGVIVASVVGLPALGAWLYLKKSSK